MDPEQKLKPRSCRRCGDSELRRVNRVGLVERTLLAYLGMYPWECVMCRRRVFVRDRGHLGHAKRAM